MVNVTRKPKVSSYYHQVSSAYNSIQVTDWSSFKQRYHQELTQEFGYETQFVDLILSKIPNLSPLDVCPQFHFNDVTGNRYIDFVILNVQKGWKLAIELDGLSKMVGKEWVSNRQEAYRRFDDFLKRQNEIVALGFEMLRFSNKTMFNQSDYVINCIVSALERQSEIKNSQVDVDNIEEYQGYECNNEEILIHTKLINSIHSASYIINIHDLNKVIGLNNQIQEQETRIDKLYKSNKSLRKKNKDLTALLQDTAIPNLLAKIQDKENEYDELQSRYTSISKEIISHKSRTSDLQVEIERLHEEIEGMKVSRFVISRHDIENIEIYSSDGVISRIADWFCSIFLHRRYVIMVGMLIVAVILLVLALQK